MLKIDKKSVKCFITFIILGSVFYLLARTFFIKSIFSNFDQSITFSHILKSMPVSEYVPLSIILSGFIFVYFILNTNISNRPSKVALLTFILFYTFILKDIADIVSHLTTLSVALRSGLKDFNPEKMLSGQKLQAFMALKQQLQMFGIDEDKISQLIYDYTPSTYQSIFNIRTQITAILLALPLAIIAGISCKICC